MIAENFDVVDDGRLLARVVDNLESARGMVDVAENKNVVSNPKSQAGRLNYESSRRRPI